MENFRKNTFSEVKISISCKIVKKTISHLPVKSRSARDCCRIALWYLLRLSGIITDRFDKTRHL